MSTLSFNRINALATLQISKEDACILLSCEMDEIDSFLENNGKTTYDRLLEDSSAQIRYLGRSKIVNEFLSKKGDVKASDWKRVMDIVDGLSAKKKSHKEGSAFMVVIKEMLIIDIRFVTKIEENNKYDDFMNEYNFGVIINKSDKSEVYNNIAFMCDSQEEQASIMSELAIMRQEMSINK